MGWLTQKKVIIKLSFYVSQPILYSPSCIIVVIGRQVEQHRGSISRYLYEIRCQVREVIISVPPRYSRYRLASLRSLQLSESPPVSHYAQIVLGGACRQCPRRSFRTAVCSNTLPWPCPQYGHLASVFGRTQWHVSDVSD